MVGGGTRRRRGGPAGSPDGRVSSAIDPISRPRSDSPGHQAAARTINKLKPLWFDAEPKRGGEASPTQYRILWRGRGGNGGLVTPDRAARRAPAHRDAAPPRGWRRRHGGARPRPGRTSNNVLYSTR